MKSGQVQLRILAIVLPIECITADINDGRASYL